MDIYRYMSFFELYDLIKHKRLKFSKLSLMDDVNEGLAMAIDTKKSSFEKKKHLLKRNSTYISCWTKEKNSIAMWLLYSRNKDSIRVKTTQEKLEYFSNKYSKKWYQATPKKLKYGTIFSLYKKAVVGEVEYRTYEDVNAQIKLPRYSSILLKPCLIKDKAYQYENEIRSSIHLVMRNEVSEEELGNHYKNHEVLEKLKIGVASELQEKILEDVIHIDVDSCDFVEEICFDQRMPSFQVDIYKEILGLDESKIVSTKIFSSKHGNI